MALRSRPPAPTMQGLKLPGYGYMNDVPVYSKPVQIPKIDQQPIPDIVKVQYGAGDKKIVGALLKTVAGQDGGLVGVTPDYAEAVLEAMGYPPDMNALPAPEWDRRIKANAAVASPLDVLEMF